MRLFRFGAFRSFPEGNNETEGACIVVAAQPTHELELVQRFQHMCQELNLAEHSAAAQTSRSEMVLSILNSCKDKGALCAAIQGVAIPNIP